MILIVFLNLKSWSVLISSRFSQLRSRSIFTINLQSSQGKLTQFIVHILPAVIKEGLGYAIFESLELRGVKSSSYFQVMPEALLFRLLINTKLKHLTK